MSDENTGNAVHVQVSNGESGEDARFAELSVFKDDFASPNTWVKRVIDLTTCPPRYDYYEPAFEGDCEEIYIDVQNYGEEGSFDLVFSTSTDSDSDEDGIYDDWEEYGVFTEGPESEDGNFIDLPAMGADPEKPDIFVHLDYMYGWGCPESDPDCEVEEYVLHDASLYSTAIELIVENARLRTPHI